MIPTSTTSHPFTHKYPGLPACISGVCWSFSVSGVCVCVLLFSVFFSGAACACPFGVVMVVALYLYARVSASRCALFCVYQCI